MAKTASSVYLVKQSFRFIQSLTIQMISNSYKLYIIGKRIQRAFQQDIIALIIHQIRQPKHGTNSVAKTVNIMQLSAMNKITYIDIPNGKTIFLNIKIIIYNIDLRNQKPKTCHISRMISLTLFQVKSLQVGFLLFVLLPLSPKSL